MAPRPIRLAEAPTCSAKDLTLRLCSTQQMPTWADYKQSGQCRKVNICCRDSTLAP